MAVSPTMVKVIAQTAIKVATDEEARKKLFIIILIPIILFLVLSSFMAYLLTNPLSLLSGELSPQEYAQAKAIKLEYDDEEIDQLIDFELPEKIIVDSSGFFAYPAPGVPMNSRRFGIELHPILKTEKMHTGVDISGSGCFGKPVIACAAGKVIKVSRKSTGYGNFVVIEHSDGQGNVWHTRYAHLSEITIKNGDLVDQGTVIGAIGSTGQSTGPHLHFEIMLNGKFVNPEKFINSGS